MPEVRLIDANALPVTEFLVVEDIYGKIGRYMVVHKAALDAAPTIEAEPVRHGRWIMLEPYGADYTHRRKCSECGEIKAQALTNFCPDCGARMDEPPESEVQNDEH